MKAIRHIGIVVSDLQKSLHFYRDLMGLKITKDMNEKGDYIDKIVSQKDVAVRTIKMATDDGQLVELLYFSTPAFPAKSRQSLFDIGCSHVAFSVDDLEYEYERLKAAGVEFNAPPQYSSDGYAKVTFCKDPDGTFIELVQVLDTL